jgi:Zn-dependent protease/CBS domain-containing protein
MGNSIRLFSVRGIAISMHVTFPLILLWSALQYGWLTNGGWNGAIFGVVVTLILFTIVVLHELGHSVVAQHYGVSVKQIVLLPIGGVAQLGSIPEKPRQELAIAIAGPLVNFGLAILMVVMGLVFGQSVGLTSLSTMFNGLQSFNLPTLLGYVFASNLFLAVFNLLPAFPMDGGRVLRALLATRMPYARATATAVTIGQSLAWLVGLWGFLQGNFFLILIAVFVYVGAGQEGQSVQLRSALGGLTVEQAYSRNAMSLAPQATLREAVELTLNTFQSDFPICDGERLVGLLTYSQLIKGIDKHGPDIPLSQVMLVSVEPVKPLDGLLEVQRRLAAEKLDALPVVDEGNFMGLITSRDIVEVYRLISSRADLLPVTISRQD